MRQRFWCGIAALLVAGGVMARPGTAQGTVTRYRVAEVAGPERALACRALGIGPDGQVIGQADVADPPRPLEPRGVAGGRRPGANAYSRFDKDGQASHADDLDALVLVYLLFHPRLVRDFYSGKLEKEAEARLPPAVRAHLSRSREIKARTQAFTRLGGKSVALPSFGGDGGVATAVNRRGQVVGAAQTSPYDPDFHRAFLAEPGTPPALTDLGTLGGRNSAAFAVNDAGMVVGEAEMRDNVVRAFLYEPGKPGLRDLGTLGGSQSYARGVNGRGAVVGWSETAQYETRAFLWEKGAMRPLDAPEGAKATYAVAVNDAGLVAGRAELAEGVTRPVLWDAQGKPTLLPTLGGPSAEANAMNAAGLVVGASDLAGGDRPERRAVLWRDGKATDLNALLPPDSGWLLEAATGVNDRGEVVGWGRYRGRLCAFVLTSDR